MLELKDTLLAKEELEAGVPWCSASALLACGGRHFLKWQGVTFPVHAANG
jgi:hypothetical protein